MKGPVNAASTVAGMRKEMNASMLSLIEELQNDPGEKERSAEPYSPIAEVPGTEYKKHPKEDE